MSLTLRQMANDAVCIADIINYYLDGLEFRWLGKPDYIRAVLQPELPKTRWLVIPWRGHLKDGKLFIALHTEFVSMSVIPKYGTVRMHRHGWSNFTAIDILDPDGKIKLQNSIMEARKLNEDEIIKYMMVNDHGVLVKIL